jgi:hypothetical protein
MFRRSPTPESPRPYLALENKVSSPFPPLTADELPLALKDLPAYVREFNATHTKTLLHIYITSGRESRNVAVPVVLRFLIPDVLRAFITLGHEEGSNGAVSETSALMVESLTVFGSREKVCASLDTGHSRIHGASETTTLAVRIYRLPEAVSMGCTHVTAVPARACAELHGKHETTVTSITRSLDNVLLIRFDGNV